MPYEKVGKNEPICIADEVPFEIPDSWEWVRLGFVSQLTDGIKIKDKKLNNLDARYLRGKSEPKTFDSGKYVSKDTRLILVDGENSGEVFIAPEDGYMGSTFKVLWISNIMYDNYLLYFLDLHQEELKNSKKGAAIPHLNKELFFNLFLPLPPLNEQKRIVQQILKLEPYIKEYRASEETIAKLNSTFPEQLKKSILQEAVQGKLVPQDENDEPASVLLERIRAEKQKLIAEGKIKKDKHESIIFRRDNSHYEKLDGIERCIDDEIPFDIPDSWQWVRLGCISTYAHTKEKINAQNADAEIWGLDLEDIEKGGRLIQKLTVGQRKSVGDKTVFYKGNILYSKLRPYLLKTLIADNDGVCSPEIIPFSTYCNINNEFVILYLKSPYVDNFINAITYGVKMPRVGTETMVNLLIPLPPLAEQQRIVDAYKSLIPYIEEL